MRDENNEDGFLNSNTKFNAGQKINQDFGENLVIKLGI